MDILLVDDEPTILMAVSEALRAVGHHVSMAHDGAAALAVLSSQRFDLLICDIRLPRVDGMRVFRHARQHAPKTDVVFITAFGAVPDAVLALKEGATDYLTKPFKMLELKERVAQIAQNRKPNNGADVSSNSRLASDAPEPIVGLSPGLKNAQERARTFAKTDYPLLITGESGTGKELVAKLVHAKSKRHRGPMVAVNCAAFPEALIEAELFGYKRGAFTGAFADRDGRFKAAHGGTLLLDEVAELPLPAQAKLLRVLQSGSFEPLGTNHSQHVDVRIISATHRDLRARAKSGLFREDLYYRLKVLAVEVPPLRERRADVPLLVDFFLAQLDPGHKARASRFSHAAMARLIAYDFPGNVRELEHAVQHAFVLAGPGTIEVDHLPSEMALFDGAPAAATFSGHACVPASHSATLHAAEIVPLATAVARFEQSYMYKVIEAAQGHKGRAAEMLKISRKSLWQKLKHKA